MKKFAAIFAAVILTVSVVMVSASAKLFTDYDYYQYDSVYFNSLPLTSGPSSFEVFGLDVYYGSDLVYSFAGSDSSEVSVARNRVSNVSSILLDSVSVFDFPSSDASSVYVNARSTSSSFHSDYEGLDISGVLVSVPSAVSSLSGSVFGAGSSLLSFVQSSWITLVSVGAFVLVLCIGAIRRLVKGV